MANPTTAKPAVAEINSGATAAATMVFFASLGPSGVIKDTVLGVLGKPWTGAAGIGAGAAPTYNATGFTAGDVTGDPCWKFIPGSKSIVFPDNRTWNSGANPTTPTFLAVFSVDYIPTDHQAGDVLLNVRYVTFGGAGMDTNSHHFAIKYKGDGTAELAFQRNGSFIDSGLPLLVTHEYAAAFTSTSAAGGGANNRLFQLYDLTAQSLISAAGGTFLTDATAFGNFSTVAFSPFILNPNDRWTKASPGQGGGCFSLSLFAANSANYNPATNATYFSDFYTDPWSYGRGTYAPANTALVVGDITVFDCTATAITLVCNRPTNGATAGVATYTYQWYRSSTACNFTPGVGNVLTGQITQKCVDTTALQDVDYWYKCVQSTTQAPGTTVTTLVKGGRLVRGVLPILGIGDSQLTNGGGLFARAFASAANADGYLVHFLNRGVASTNVYGTGANTWQASQAWLTNAHAEADAAFTLSTVWNMIQAGTNDAGNSLSATDFLTYSSAIGRYNSALSRGTVWNAPPWREDITTESALRLLADYQAKLQLIGDGNKQWFGSKINYSTTLSMPLRLSIDSSSLPSSLGLLHFEQQNAYFLQGIAYWNTFRDTVINGTPYDLAVGVNAAGTTVTVGWADGAVSGSGGSVSDWLINGVPPSAATVDVNGAVILTSASTIYQAETMEVRYLGRSLKNATTGLFVGLFTAATTEVTQLSTQVRASGGGGGILGGGT